MLSSKRDAEDRYAALEREAQSKETHWNDERYVRQTDHKTPSCGNSSLAFSSEKVMMDEEEA